MVAFFSAVKRSCDALYGDLKFKSYYDGLFHLDAFSSLICHSLRLIYDTACFLTRLVLTPLCVINPLMWPGLPNHMMHIIDNGASALINAVTLSLMPLIIFARTLMSLVRGYEKGTEYDCGEEEELNDLKLATTIL